MHAERTWHLWGHDWTPCSEGWQMGKLGVMLQPTAGSWLAWRQKRAGRICEGQTPEEALNKLLGAPQVVYGVTFYPLVNSGGFITYLPDLPSGEFMLFSTDNRGVEGSSRAYQIILEEKVREWLEEPVVLWHLAKALKYRREDRGWDLLSDLKPLWLLKRVKSSYFDRTLI